MTFLSFLESAFAVFCFLLLVPLALAVPVGWREGSWRRFGLAVLASLAGIWVPLLVFVLRIGSTPLWKGNGRLGWVDCFPEGSVVLLPLVLFASAGFYRIVILKRGEPVSRWCEVAIYIGAVVSSGCLAVGLRRVGYGSYRDLAGFIVVPCYVVGWYWYLSARVWMGSSWRSGQVIWSVLATVPFWLLSVWLSKRAYAALPENPPDCFVVTAAQRGHARVVGPFFRIERRGVSRLANRQLIRFWRFEAAWKDLYPRSHGTFRRLYNRIGPVAARLIRRPILADIAYLLLKPAEFGCWLLNAIWGKG